MKVTVCMGSHCVMVGSMNIMTQLEELKESMPEINLELDMVKCLGGCKEGKAPVVIIDGEMIKGASSQDIMAKIMADSQS